MAKKNVDESPMMKSATKREQSGACTDYAEREQARSMSKQFRELKEKHPEAMLLFRCGDFYETYQNDAKEAAKVLGITLTWRTPQKRHAPGDYTDAMAGFPHHALDSYLPKLVRAGKRVAICDMLPEPPKPKRGTTETNNESNNQQTSEDESMKTNENNIETKNVQNAQVNNVKTDVDIAEVQDIVPVVTKKKSEGRGKTEEGPKVRKSPLSSAANDKVHDSVPQVRLVVYTTRHGDQAPRIDGFGGEDDPRWKRHYDEKLRLKEAAKEADKKNEKLKARMKGKSKEEKEKMMKQWVSVGSDPFNATVRTDFTTGEKAYFMLMGAKYLDVARELVDAYNSGDAAAIAAAEQAVMDVKNGIVAERQAAREERKAAREANTDSTDKTEKPAAPAMSAQEQAMFDLFKKFMAGDATAMQQVGAMMAKQAA